MKYEVLHGSFFYKKEKPVFNDISFSVDEGKILNGRIIKYVCPLDLC